MSVKLKQSAQCKHKITGKPSTITFKDSCFPDPNIRPSVISSAGCACIRVGLVLTMFHRQSRNSWSASASSLHLQHHCSHIEKHTSPRGRTQQHLFVDKADLWIYESDRLPGLNHHFDEAWHSCMPVVRGLRTHPVCYSGTSPHFSYAFLSRSVFFSS